MAYRALYREYRPRVFAEVMGQEHITRVLKNQIRSGHTSHAYLFCGSRGTGKTSTAKILARAVNCLSPRDGEPCLECDACTREDAYDVDIIEMDAASNTGVDDIRTILEKTRFTPMYLKKKVYIIDEVHMLSSSAFNALLKTLEEPPAHIVFILATTEPQKLPATIISRCQRFDFRRLTVDCIVDRLTAVLAASGASATPDALAVIARYAQGGMRDAISLADQCLSFLGRGITADDVYSILGSAGEDTLFAVADHLIRMDAAGALAAINGVVADGRDLNVFMQDITNHFRCLLLAGSCGECADMLDCTKDAMARYLAQAKELSVRRLLSVMDVLLAAQNTMRWLPFPRPAVESALVRICHPEDELSYDGLAARIEALEKRPAAAPRREESAKEELPLYEEPPFMQSAPLPASGEDDLPPFDYEPEPSERPAPKAQKADTPAPKAQTEKPAQRKAERPAQSAASGGVSQAVWEAVLSDVNERSRAAYGMLMKAGRVWTEGSEFLAGFDQNTKFKFFLRPENMLLVEQVVQKHLPGLTFRPVLIEDGGLTEENARRLFGDALTVIE